MRTMRTSVLICRRSTGRRRGLCCGLASPGGQHPGVPARTVEGPTALHPARLHGHSLRERAAAQALARFLPAPVDEQNQRLAQSRQRGKRVGRLLTRQLLASTCREALQDQIPVPTWQCPFVYRGACDALIDVIKRTGQNELDKCQRHCDSLRRATRSRVGQSAAAMSRWGLFFRQRETYPHRPAHASSPLRMPR